MMRRAVIITALVVGLMAAAVAFLAGPAGASGRNVDACDRALVRYHNALARTDDNLTNEEHYQRAVVRGCTVFEFVELLKVHHFDRGDYAIAIGEPREVFRAFKAGVR